MLVVDPCKSENIKTENRAKRIAPPCVQVRQIFFSSRVAIPCPCDMSMGVGTLSVSGDRLRCDEVAKLLQTMGICGDVSPNTTVLDGHVEPGCRIRIVSAPVPENTRLVWDSLKTRFGLQCAHVRLSAEDKSGCVYDVYRPSACPGKQVNGAPWP